METAKSMSYCAKAYCFAFAFSICFLPACKSKNLPYVEKESALKKNEVVKHVPEFLGDWEKVYPFAVTNISISPDGRFKFRQQGCLGISFTEGRWSQSFNDIILDSDSIFNFEVAKNANTVTEKQSGIKASADTIALSILIQSNNIRAFFRDSTPIYFARKRLFIRNGKLADMPFEAMDSVTAYRKLGASSTN